MEQTLVSVEDYLSTSYRPNVDHLDGRIEKRNLGEQDHSKLLFRVALLIKRMRILVPFIETPIRVAAERYRVPDICACNTEPDEQVFTRPSDLCIEIPSLEDRLSRITKRAEDHLEMGVPVVWVLASRTKKAYLIDRAAAFREVTGAITSANPPRQSLACGNLP